MIGSAMDMMAQISANTTSSATTSSSTSGDNKSSGEFEKLMEKHQSESSSDTSTNKNENSEGDNVTQGTEGNTAPGEEVTDVQMEMMAALTMNPLNFRTVDVVIDTEEVELDLDLMVTVEDEVVEVPEVSMGEELFVDVPDLVLDSSESEVTVTGTFEEGEIVLEEEILVADTDVTVEVDVEIDDSPETEVVQSEETEIEEEVELETEVSVEEAPEEEVEQKVSSKATVEDQEEGTTDDTVIVQENQQGTVVFEKVEARPVKVAETVNTQEPDMEGKLAKIIQNADANGEKSVTIRLTPEGLGTITAQITHTAEGNLQIILQTTDDAATILLKNHVNQLAMALQSNNQTVTIEVHNTEEGQLSEQDLEEQNEQGNQQGEQEKQEEQTFEYSEDFMQQLRLGLVKEFSLEISE